MDIRKSFTALPYFFAFFGSYVSAQGLPPWNEGPTKTAIIQFVQQVTTDDGPDFVPRDARIAVFENDGTLWSEKPYYFQLAFALDRIKNLHLNIPSGTRTRR